MVGITGVVSIIFLLIGMSLIFYLVVEKPLSTMFEVQIFDDEEELINIFPIIIRTKISYELLGFIYHYYCGRLLHFHQY